MSRPKLPAFVLASWRAKDWDDRKMVAREYAYEDVFGQPVTLSDADCLLYYWGDPVQDEYGGQQGGRLKK